MAKQVTLTDINTGDIIYPISTIDSIFDQYNNSVKTLLNNVSNKISTVYIPSGSSTFANLPTPSKDLIGHVYNVTDAFTTTSSFLEGSGKTYPAGTNVVIILNNESYLYDVLAGFIDLSPYRLKTDTTNSITEGSTNLYFTNARALSATSGTYLPISGNAVSATKLNTARTIALSGGATGTATSFDGTANITIPVTSLDATKLSGTASINTTGAANHLDYFYSTNRDNAVNCNDTYINGNYYYSGNGPTGMSTADGALYVQSHSLSWVGQIAQDYRNGELAVRGKNNGTWTTWIKIIDSSNYNTYTPTKTGTGASGTWGISITGNAATATNSTQLGGVALDGLFTSLTTSGETLSATIGGVTKTTTTGMTKSQQQVMAAVANDLNDRLKVLEAK